MNTWMRKYHKHILIILVLVCIVSMVLYFGNFGRSGGNNPSMPTAGPLAQVDGLPIMPATFRQQLAQVAERQKQYTGKLPTFKELADNGTAKQVLDGLINEKLIELEAAKHNFSLDQDTIVDYLKTNPFFQNDSGQFDPARWNSWVESQKDTNWNAIYADVRSQLEQKAFGELVRSSARVLDSEVRDAFAEAHTKVEVKYAAIEPTIEVTDQELHAYYDAHPDQFQLPAKYQAQVVAISLTPPKPEVVDEVLQKARGGQDFGELARQYSTLPSKDQGGDLGWMREGTPMPPARKVIFDMNVGDVSDPVLDRGIYYIFKVTDQRTDTTVNEREVRASAIGISATLPDAEKAARKSLAEAVVTEAKKAGDLEAAAAANGLTVETTNMFSIQTPQVTNVADSDAYPFKRAFNDLKMGDVTDVIEGTANYYVAKVTGYEAPVQQPFDEVTAQVKSRYEAEQKASPAYQDRVKDYADKILAQCDNLDQIKQKFPDLPVEIKTTPEFSMTDYLYEQGLFWNNKQVFQMLRGKEPGAMVGPIADMTGKAYFIELVKRTPPDEKAWKEDFDKEKEKLRTDLLTQREQETLTDYVANLREQAMQSTPILVDEKMLNQILGVSDEETTTPSTDTVATPEQAPAESNASAPAKPAPADQAPADQAPADAGQ